MWLSETEDCEVEAGEDGKTDLDCNAGEEDEDEYDDDDDEAPFPPVYVISMWVCVMQGGVYVTVGPEKEHGLDQ